MSCPAWLRPYSPWRRTCVSTPTRCPQVR
jgi:hypothetical protein